MAGSLSLVDYGVVAVFFTVMVGVGVYYSRRPTSSAQFFGNDKTVPWWLSGVSFYMNSFSAKLDFRPRRLARRVAPRSQVAACGQGEPD